MTRELQSGEITRYRDDGVALVREAISDDWVDRMNQVVSNQMARPSEWANDAKPDNKRDRFFTDRYQWQSNREINAFLHESGCAGLVARAMGSNTARFYFDHILVKEPGTPTPTPWHQDVPYWPFLGKQIASIWVALTPCDAASSGLEFVRGSHLDDKYYAPKQFGERENHPSAWQKEGKGDEMPDIEADRDRYDIISFDMNPGDALIFSAWTIHGAPGNSSPTKRRAAISTRWLGDDVTWYPHDGADPTVTQDHVSIQPGEPPVDDKVFPLVFQQLEG